MGSGEEDLGKRPAWSPAPHPARDVPNTPVSYLLEAGPALAETQTGAGMDLDHHLPGLLSLGRVVQPTPHGVASGSGGQMEVKFSGQ